ncbi:MAG: hypothetical protein R6T91_03055 [Bacteroidales bacterium]
MRKIIKIIGAAVLMALILLISFCDQQHKSEAQIEATFTHSTGNKVFLHELLPDGWIKIDSAFVNNDGKISFTVQDTTAGLYTLSTDRDNLVIVQTVPGKTEKLKADIRQIPSTYQVTCCAGSRLLQDFKQQTIKHLDRIDSLVLELNRYQDSSNYLKVKKQTDSLVQQIHQKQKHYQTDLVRQNKTTLAVLIPLFQPFGQEPVLTIRKYPALFKEINDSLSAQYPNNPHVLELNKRVERYQEQENRAAASEQRLKPSLEAPDFAADRIDGTPKKLSGLRGKYVVLDFWSEQNPQYKERQKKIHTIVRRYDNVHHFTVYHGTDRLIFGRNAKSYPQQSTHTTGKKVVLKMYNIREQDRLFLIAPDGSILARDITPETLASVINENRD